MCVRFKADDFRNDRGVGLRSSLDNWYDAILIVLDAPAGLGLKRQRQPLAMKAVRKTTSSSSASSPFQRLPLGESQLVKIEISIVVELLTVRPTKYISGRIRHEPHLTNVSV